MSSEKQYNIVAGFNRGGTSALMASIRECGIPIVGFAYPHSINVNYARIPEEGEEEMEIVKENVHKDGGLLDPMPKTKDRNPTGYWEIPSICLDRGLRSEHMWLGNDGNVVKVPFNILSMSQFDLVKKAVVIIRDPKKVISSQMVNKEPEEGKEELFSRVIALGIIHNAVLSLRWMEEADIPYIKIFFKDLLEEPVEVMKEVCEHIGRGNPEYATKVIDSSVPSSEPIEYESAELELAKDFYNNPQPSFGVKLDELRDRIHELNDGSLPLVWERVESEEGSSEE